MREFMGIAAITILVCACSSSGSDDGRSVDPLTCAHDVAEPTGSSQDCAIAGKCATGCGGGIAYSCGEHMQNSGVAPAGLTGCYTETNVAGVFACCEERQCVRRTSEDAICKGQRAFSCAPDMVAPSGCIEPSDTSKIPQWMHVVCCP